MLCYGAAVPHMKRVYSYFEWHSIYILSLQERVREDVSPLPRVSAKPIGPGRIASRSRQRKIHRLQVGLHGSETGLPWTTNPPSPVVRWVHYAGLESPVMILPGVKSNQIKIYIAPLYRV